MKERDREGRSKGWRTRKGREDGREEHLSQLFFVPWLPITEENGFNYLPRIMWCFMQVPISREGPEPHMPLQNLSSCSSTFEKSIR